MQEQFPATAKDARWIGASIRTHPGEKKPA
jgi:hypothetical protein